VGRFALGQQIRGGVTELAVRKRRFAIVLENRAIGASGLSKTARLPILIMEQRMLSRKNV
jgi:hypothetical protein